MPLSRTSRSRLRWASSRVVRSSSSMPALAARAFSASGNDRPSRFITKLKTSPPSPQPKHFHESRAGVTVNDGVFSPWNGQRPLYVVPAFLSWTVSPTTSTTLSLFLTSAATPTANRSSCRASPPKRDLPDMTRGLSSLDKPDERRIARRCQYPAGVLTGDSKLLCDDAAMPLAARSFVLRHTALRPVPGLEEI